jgi:hypothetical protein
VIYSLLLHLRVLVDFFFVAPKSDDCRVGHFRSLPAFEAAFPGKITVPSQEEIEELRLNLNKRLAHLTATRWREARPPRDYYARYFDDIDALLALFEKALPDDVGLEFTCAMRMWEQAHPASISR